MPQAWRLTSEQNKLIEATVVHGDLPNHWRSVVKDAISAHLKDPYSAKFTYHEPKMRVEWHNEKRYVYYDVPVGVNAKNNFGAYTGEQMWYVIFGNDIQVRAPK